MMQQSETGATKPPSLNAWNLSLGQSICSDIQAGLNHEWLITNGLGGYAAGSIVGATTRSYHGLLVAALRPPVERYVLVSKLDEEIELPSQELLKLGVNEYVDGTLDPQGARYLLKVALEGDIPCFSYQLDPGLILEKRIWMEYGQNTTYIQYTLHGSLADANSTSATSQPLNLTLRPFCLSRDHHSCTHGSPDWRFLVEAEANRCQVQANADGPTYQLIAGPEAHFTATGLWYWHVLHRRDRERGLPDEEDVYQPGTFQIALTPGERVTLVLSAEKEPHASLGTAQHEDHVAQAYTYHQRRIKQLLAVAERGSDHLASEDPVLARLVIAADQFIVARPEYLVDQTGKRYLHLAPDHKTIIAGYPWFTDWGRDSMISLPGLLLHTGRYSEARGLIKAFASFTNQGLIPNRFPDSGDAPEYNTADATLWMFHAIDGYLATTGDWSLLKELFATLDEIIHWHLRGTFYNIGVDPNDGLLHAGTPGIQLTWMDAKVGDWVVTPRRGKPVEINALWYAALSSMESWAVRLAVDATQYSQLRSQVRKSFAARFWYEQGGYLYDVVDVDGVAGQNDTALRPNQLFAASLTRRLLSEEQTRRMLECVTSELLTPMGLRSLSPKDPDYHSHFGGDQRQRDGAYHQGAVWTWLIGPYVDVYLQVHNDPNALNELLQPLLKHLWTTCLGMVSEVTEPEPPFTPAGCFAQAWSIAELLRCWRLLER